MSIFDKIAAPFESAWGSLESAAKSVWSAISKVWGFLTGIAKVLDEAWVWMVHGAEWIGKGVEGWAAEVFNAVRHTLFTVIPNAVKFALDEAIHWAGREIGKLAGRVADLFSKAFRWVERLIGKVTHAIRDVFNRLTRWAATAVEFVAKAGKTLIAWITHPEILAQFLLAHIALPLIRFALKIAASVGALIFRAFAALLPSMASAIEDLLAKVI